MKILKISGDLQQSNTWLSDTMEGFAVYDEKTKAIRGYLLELYDNPDWNTINLIAGSYNEETHELEFFEVCDDNDFSMTLLYIFRDAHKEGVWGNVDWNARFFSVNGKVRIYIRESFEKTPEEVYKMTEQAEREIGFSSDNEIDGDFHQFVLRTFPGVFKDYFGSSTK